MRPIKINTFSTLEINSPTHALIENVDLVVTRYGETEDKLSVFYGRCAHRGALLADGHVSGMNLICGVHDWDFRVDTGISEYNNDEVLPKFASWVEDDKIFVDADEIAAWGNDHPQPFDREAYLDPVRKAFRKEGFLFFEFGVQA
jgi:methylamine---glutamate N-methyltransferase subunit C